MRLHDEVEGAIRFAQTAHVGPAWLIQGSGSMYLQGIPVEPEDIDIFVKPWLYTELKSRGWAELHPREGDPPMLLWTACRTPVHAWSRWDDRWPGPEPIAQAFENIAHVRSSGRTYPVISLPLLRHWKTLIYREKDQRHIELIDAYAETEVFGTGG